MAVIGSLSVKLGLVTVEWDQATAKAKQQAKDLQKAFNALTGEVRTLYGHFKSLGGATGLGGLGLAALTQQTLEFANATQDLAKGFDISVAKVLQFKDAIKTSGGNAEGAEKMLSSLFSKIEDARGGNEAAISQFERLGITFDELKSLKPEEAINRIFNALNEGSLSTFQRVKMVKEMLGKQGIGLSIDEVAAKLNMSVESYRKHEASVKKLADVSDNLKSSLDNLKLAFADVISPLTDGDGLIKVETFKAALYAIGSVYLIGQLTKVYEIFKLIRGALAANAALMSATNAMGGWKGVAAAAAGLAAFYAAQKVFGDETPSGSRSAEGKLEDTRPDSEKNKDLDANRKELIAMQAKVKLQEQLTTIEHKQNQLRIQGLKGDKTRVELRGVELVLEQQLATIAASREQALSKENLSIEQEQAIRMEFDKEEIKARAKARDDKAFILAQDKIANQVSAQQTSNLYDQLNLQNVALGVKLQTIGMDEKAAALAELEMQATQERIRLANQFALDKMKTGQTDVERRETEKRYELEMAAVEGRRLAQVEIINKTYMRRLQVIKETTRFQNQSLILDRDLLSLEVNRYQMRDSDFRIQQEQIQLKRTLLDLEKQIANAAQMGKGEAYDLEVKRINELISAEKELSNARQKAIIDEEARRKSFSEGFNAAARQFAYDAENYGKLGADMFNSAIGNMNSAIDNFVRTGKFNFKDFAKSIIQDIMAMILKFQAMQLVMMGMRAMGFGGFGGMSFQMSGGGGGVPMAAAGGEIDRPTIVGENGPELFIPQRRGTVIPNMQASSAISGGPSVVYNGPYIASMSAIDTQSAVQFLSKNKQAVWSANQSAQRSLPVSK